MSREACIELARRVGREPDAVIEEWLERASIREFEGGQPRGDAERDALADLREALLARKGPRSAGTDATATRDRSSKP